ncbi:MAG: hypothetical protein AAB787_01740 [Patescibacteria group bacterium]
MNLVIVGLFAIALCIAFGTIAEASNYPPAVKGKVLNLNDTRSLPNGHYGEFQISSVQLFVYDEDYDAETSFDEQVIHGLVRITVPGPDSATFDFSLYGNQDDTTANFARVFFVSVEDTVSAAKVDITPYLFTDSILIERIDSVVARVRDYHHRALIIKLYAGHDGWKAIHKAPISPYVRIFPPSKSTAGQQSNTSK